MITTLKTLARRVDALELRVASDVMTLDQAARLLGTTRRWVREHSKELGGRRIGRKFLFHRPTLAGFGRKP